MAVAKKFGTEGFDTILVALDEEALKSMKDELDKLNISSDYVVADASESTSLYKAIEEVKSEYGTPDCVVYNVGITVPDAPGLSADDLTAHFKADVAGALTTVNGFADDKFAEKKGAILFTGGGLATYPADGFIPLSIDKAALRALAYILNSKYKEKGIFVGTVTVCGTINASPFLDTRTEPSQEFIDMKFEEALGCLLRISPQFYPTLFDFNEAWKIDLMQFMEENCTEDMSMEEFASYTGRSLATFKRDFSKLSSMSPQKWIIDRRLEKAMTLLQSGTSVTETYKAVGFKNRSHFTKSYTQKYGMAPSMSINAH